MFKKRIIKIIREWILDIIPDYEYYKSIKNNVVLGKNVKLYFPVRLYNVTVGDYSYIGMYSHMKYVEIGKFCSIGPGCFFGWGIHPIHGISTAPMFYSTGMQNGTALSRHDKIIENKKIIIGNDVFIGMNVTILDGVRIGDGAVIGAGAVVSKDVPEYAVAAGNPIRVIRFRFSEQVRQALHQIRWWDFKEEDLRLVEENVFQVEKFIELVKNRNK